MNTIFELVFAAALVAGVFLNWGEGWALIVLGVLGLAGLFLSAATGEPE